MEVCNNSTHLSISEIKVDYNLKRRRLQDISHSCASLNIFINKLIICGTESKYSFGETNNCGFHNRFMQLTQ